MNFTKEELLNENDEDAEIIKSWMNVCSDGFNTVKWTWGSIFPSRNIKSNTPNSFSSEQHSAIYFISDNKLHLLKDKNQYLISDQGKEVETLANMWFDDRQYTKNIFNELNQWNKITNYSSPCSDIIICDQYFLKDKNLLEYNVYKLLEILCYKSTCARMNIVIFTQKFENVLEDRSFDQIRNNIKLRVKSRTGLPPYVTIVTGSGQKLKEHDRTIFTNYKLYNSGDSFNYFNCNGNKITQGRFFHVHSLVSRENKDTAKLFLEDMQILYDSIKKVAPDCIYKENNCISNYLQI